MHMMTKHMIVVHVPLLCTVIGDIYHKSYKMLHIILKWPHGGKHAVGIQNTSYLQLEFIYYVK